MVLNKFNLSLTFYFNLVSSILLAYKAVYFSFISLFLSHVTLVQILNGYNFSIVFFQKINLRAKINIWKITKIDFLVLNGDSIDIGLTES